MGDHDDERRGADAPTVVESARAHAREHDRTATDASPRPSAGSVRLDFIEVDPRYYDVGEEIAHGGMGRILRARDLRLDREVAIKELLDPRMTHAARFEREARVTARLQHPAIVPVHEAGRWPSGEPFYAMKLVHGRSLKSVITKAASFDDRLALLPHVIAVADALACAHEQRIVHRDLKPSNVLVGAFGETVVIDWGLAKDLAATDDDVEARPSRPSDADLTRAGAVIGTPSYMPPEQARGEPVDERADVYAIGAILYTLLGGVAPYDGGDSGDVLARVIEAPPLPLPAREPRIAPDLLAIVERAMARDPADRYPTARELAEELRRFQTGQLVASHRYTRGQLLRRFARRHRFALGVVSIAFAIVAAVGVVSVVEIIGERDRARAAQRGAESERAKAIERSDSAIIAAAREAVERDPTEALSLISTLSAGTRYLSAARVLAAKARSEHVPIVRRAHDAAITVVRVSPDGTQLATAGVDQTVRVWNAVTLEGRILGRHDNRVEDLAFSPDGRTLASAGLDGTVRLWDLIGGTSATLTHPGQVLRVLFSPDGATIASAGSGTVRLWNARSHIQHAEVADSFAGWESLMFAPDGRSIALAAQGGVRIADAATGIGELVPGSAFDGPFAFSPDGRTLVVTTERGGVVAWDLALRKSRELGRIDVWPEAEQAHHGSRGGATSLAFAPAGSTFATFGPVHREVQLWRLDGSSPRTLATLDDEDAIAVHGRGRIPLVFSADGTRLASAGTSAHVWDLGSGDALTLVGARGSIAGTAFARGGAVLVAAAGNSVLIWPLHDYPERVVARHTGPARQVQYLVGGSLVSADGHAIEHRGMHAIAGGIIGRVAWSRTGERLALLDGDGIVRVIDSRTFEVRALDGKLRVDTRDWPRDPNNRSEIPYRGSTWVSEILRRTARARRDRTGCFDVVVFSPDARRIAAHGTRDGTIRIWELATGTPRVIDLGDTDVEDFVFAPDGATLAAADSTGRIYLIPADRGEPRVLVGHTDPVEAIAFTADGRTLVSASTDRTVRVWDLSADRGRELGRHDAPVAALALAPDGKLAATGGADGTLRLWALDGATKNTFEIGDDVTTIAFSPDGATLASARTDGTVELRDVASGSARTIDGPSNVGQLAWSLDGKQLAVAYADGTVRVYADDLPRDEAGLRAWIAGALGTGSRR